MTLSDNIQPSGKTNRDPVAGRPLMPEGYGPPEGQGELLPWQHARERLRAARNYWIATAHPDCRPHVTPVWGVWLDNRLYFDGSPETRRGRNIAANPAIVVHLENGEDVVIVEGAARQLTSPPRTLTTRLSQGYKEKYASSGYAPEPDTWDQGGLYEMQPRKALAWTQFPNDCTRWIFS